MSEGSPRPSSSCERLQQELYDALREVDDEGNLETKVKILRAFVFGHGLAVLDHIARIYRRLPRRPWIVNVVSGVGLVTILSGVVFAAVKFSHFENCATTNYQIATKADRKADRALLRQERMDGNLEIMMRAQGLQPLPPVKDSADTLP